MYKNVKYDSTIYPFYAVSIVYKLPSYLFWCCSHKHHGQGAQNHHYMLKNPKLNCVSMNAAPIQLHKTPHHVAAVHMRKFLKGMMDNFLTPPVCVSLAIVSPQEVVLNCSCNGMFSSGHYENSTHQSRPST